MFNHLIKHDELKPVGQNIFVCVCVPLSARFCIVTQGSVVLLFFVVSGLPEFNV